jgi:hypothetical protein
MTIVFYVHGYWLALGVCFSSKAEKACWVRACSWAITASYFFCKMYIAVKPIFPGSSLRAVNNWFNSLSVILIDLSIVIVLFFRFLFCSGPWSRTKYLVGYEPRMIFHFTRPQYISLYTIYKKSFLSF